MLRQDVAGLSQGPGEPLSDPIVLQASAQPPFKTRILSARGLQRPKAVRPRGRQGDVRVIHRRVIMPPLPGHSFPSSPQQQAAGRAAHKCLFCLEPASAWSLVHRLREGEESLVGLAPGSRSGQWPEPNPRRQAPRGPSPRPQKVPVGVCGRHVHANVFPPPGDLPGHCSVASTGNRTLTRAVADYEWTASRSGRPLSPGGM